MNSQTDYKLLLSLAVIAIVWGTTYLGIRIAVESIPPWFVTSIRQGIAALLLGSIVWYKKQFEWIGFKNLKHHLIASVLMIVIANGFTTMSEQTLPSGLTSILSALCPLVIFIGSILLKLQKPSIKGFIGVVVGFLGVVFIFRDGLGDILDPNYKTGILFLSIGILGWSSGVVYTKIHTHKTNTIALDLFYQFLISAIIQVVLAFTFTENINPNDWTSKSFYAVVYLAVFGSVITFFSYHYALKRVTAVQVSILGYVNTIIAVFLGWLLLDEIITSDFIIATILIIAGVFITNYKKNV